MSVLCICLFWLKGLIYENVIYLFVLVFIESMVESIRNIYVEDKIFFILI